MAARRSQLLLPRPHANMDGHPLPEWWAHGRDDDVRLRPPPTPPGVVFRGALIDRLLAAREQRIVSIVAPAGWGKTTLLAQWLGRETRPVAWLSIDRSDNDPATLLAHIVAAVRRAGIASAGSLRYERVVSDAVVAVGIPRVVNALLPPETYGILVLDNVENISSRGSNDLIAELAARLPSTVQLAVASRTNVRLPIPVLRSQGVLMELTPADLAMDEKEARALLDGVGVDAISSIDELMSHTEGWPTGLYLAGLATKSGSPQLPGGDDRFVGDYLRSEVLEHFSEARVTFLTRTAVLDRFCGSLCDAVLRTTGSARTIERLEGSNLLLVPLDHTRSWYRYHHLFREFLQDELRRREPGVMASLNRRAAEWFDANAMPEQAISYALAAADLDFAADIMSRVMGVTYGLGRADTVFDWMRRLEHADQVNHYPAVAAIGALVYALSGDEAATDRWASWVAPHGASDSAELPQPAWILRALLAREGTAQVRADAQTALRGGSPDPQWIAAALELEGFSYLWDGDTERADSLFGRAVAAGEWFSCPPTVTSALAARAVIATGRDDWEAAGQFTDKALALVHDYSLEMNLTSGLAFAVASRCAVRRNNIRGAQNLLAQATAVRPRLTTAAPGVSLQTLLEIARAHSELSDIAGARLVMREASSILDKCRGLGLLASQWLELKTHLDAQATTGVGALTLTNAELRLLPYLTTHLSFPEIGERLFLSRHTVKTQAMSIYRKFGASSRSEAVSRAREIGLLNP